MIIFFSNKFKCYSFVIGDGSDVIIMFFVNLFVKDEIIEKLLGLDIFL